MTLLDLQNISSKKKYKSSPPDYLNYVIIGVVLIGLITAVAIVVPPFVANNICYGPVCGVNDVDYTDSCAAFFAGVEIKHKGICLRCNDPDGLNEFTTSEVVFNNGTLKDVCVSSTELNEAICEEGVGKYVSLFCDVGYACDEGACVEMCVQDFNEINLYERGNVIFGNTSNVSDVCVSNTTVKKYFCDNNTISYDEIECDFGFHCNEGICIENSCEDSDGGNDVYVNGTITKGKDSFTDACITSNKVKEYYCENGEITYEEITCSLGYECSYGQCQETVCSDSDFGLNQYVKGTTKLGSDVFVDSCYSPYSVLEYYCLDKEIRTTTLTCGSGSECVDGLCKVVDCQKTEKSIDLTDSKYTIGTYDDDVNLEVLKGSIVEIKSGYLLEVSDLENLTVTFTLYKNIEEYRDGEELCDFSINKGSSLTKYCGKTITPIKVVSLNDTTDNVRLEIDVFYATQYYSADGFIVDWTDSVACSEDEVSYNEFEVDFFPYLDADSDMEFKTKKIQFLDDYATIKDVDLDDKTLRLIFGGKTFTFEDKDTFEYKNVDYVIDLEFNELGLTKLIVEED